MMRRDIFVHQDQKVRVENSSTYTVNAISRDAAGEYKCSLVADEKMEASQNVVVSCKYVLANARGAHEHPCWNMSTFLTRPKNGC